MRKIGFDASLRDLQVYIKEVEEQRGFAKETALEKCLLLGEEVGELFKAVRLKVGLGTDAQSGTHDVSMELADVLSFVVAIANRFEVDLAVAFEAKEKINSRRTWSAGAPLPRLDR
jgi:NTP pyrophosphatase (non-canonical NTP hydrolase)|tara:strand:+ start:693 stop:1040 length:348 start_codon:yes stop_codon:yes gene_type:complete